MSKQQKIEKLKLLRQKQILRARESFWYFCKALAPDFYKDSRPHLRILCEILQKIYEGTLLKADGTPYRRLMLNLPPRFGKSRTLILFCQWVLGKNKANRIITCSYNDDMASDFSRYTRDGIVQDKNGEFDICYSDIFPLTKIKNGNSSFEEWALEGQFFTYKGAGVGGSITGKGGNITIVDDPIKDAEAAYNENALDKIWRWYTGTFLSRGEGEDPIQIVNMTRWAKKDICGRILEGPEANEWYVLKMEAVENGKPLCPELLSMKKYNSLKLNMDSAIFRANYHQEPVDIQGRLYQNLKTYKDSDIPKDEDGSRIFEHIISYTDTADEGADWLCSIIAGTYKGEAWILDVYFTDKPMEVTEVEEADFLVKNKVNKAKIESNNGGKGFARNVERIIWEKYKTKKVCIEWFHQSLNKVSRILTNSSFIINHVFFPEGWNYKWPDFYQAINDYQREGKNKHDDAPDCLTGIAEMVGNDDSDIYLLKGGNIWG